MGYLVNSQSGLLTYLKPIHTFGRDPITVDTYLSYRHASRLQFIIRFHGDGWTIEDVSKNGTFLNGHRLEKSRKPLSVGDLISLPGDQKINWELKNVSPPRPVLIHQNGHDFIELATVNLLPTEENFEFSIFREDNEWKIDKANEVMAIEGGDTVLLSGQYWSFFPHDIALDTVTHEMSRGANPVETMEFYVSLNEENIRVVIKGDSGETDFGYKTHHDILLHLSRQRFADRERGIPICEQGWLATDLLLDQLKISESHLNTLIYRCRKSMAECGINNIRIERRSGEIRLSPCNLTLRKGDECMEYTIF